MTQNELNLSREMGKEEKDEEDSSFESRSKEESMVKKENVKENK